MPPHFQDQGFVVVIVNVVGTIEGGVGGVSGVGCAVGDGVFIVLFQYCCCFCGILLSVLMMISVSVMLLSVKMFCLPRHCLLPPSNHFPADLNFGKLATGFGLLHLPRMPELKDKQVQTLTFVCLYQSLLLASFEVYFLFQLGEHIYPRLISN